MEKSYKYLVSVLIGTFNRAELLDRCLKSVFGQSIDSVEAIVVDDVSTDNTLDVLRRYQMKYGDRMKYISNEINRGIAFNSNLAFSLSSGKYLALLGDDDEWIDRDKLANQIKEFDRNDRLGLCTTWWDDVSNGQIINEHRPHIFKDKVGQILRSNGVYCGSSPLILRDAWVSVGGFDERFPRGTDSELFRSIIVRSPYEVKIQEVVTTKIYLDSPNRMTLTKELEALRRVRKSNLLVIGKYPKELSKRPVILIYRLKNLVTCQIKIFIKRLKQR